MGGASTNGHGNARAIARLHSVLANGGMLPGPNVAWGGGLGGSLAVIDFDQRATFAYVMNK